MFRWIKGMSQKKTIALEFFDFRPFLIFRIFWTPLDNFNDKLHNVFQRIVVKKKEFALAPSSFSRLTGKVGSETFKTGLVFREVTESLKHIQERNSSKYFNIA